MQVDPKKLVRRLTPTATRMLEASVGKAASTQSPDVTVEHMVLQMLSDEKGEASGILHEFAQNRLTLTNRIEKILHRTEGRSSSRPVFSETLFRWFEDAWLLASLEHGEQRLRTGMLFFQLIRKPGRYIAERLPELEEISVEQLSNLIDDILSASQEAYEAAPEQAMGGGSAAPGPDGQPAPHAGGRSPDSALARFCNNLTAAARDGEVDPIFGRHREIRQMLDILCRRRKNNPLVVGEAGVGKTAMAEGLALEIVGGRVPKHLKHTDLLTLDLGRLQAGASVKGEFENRLKAVISEVKASEKPVILFIDEAHQLIGAGAQKGSGDAANLLKPALARGELRTVAATTWAEYKKFFEKDAALERRFQPVPIDEPSVEDAVVMLRGLKDIYEEAHQVRILDEAVVAAVEYSDRYISGRLLPDKAVDLLDTTAARVRVERESKPEDLVEIESQIEAHKREIAALQREIDDGDEKLVEPKTEAEARLDDLRAQRDALTERWEKEKEELEAILAEREEAEAAEQEAAEAEAEDADAEDAAPEEGEDRPSIVDHQDAPPRVDAPPAEAGAEVEEPEEEPEEEDEDSSDRLVHIDVDSDSIARTVSSWTGIPLGRMMRDTVSTVRNLEDSLRSRVVGQDHALLAVGETLRAAYAGIRNPTTPIGVMLFVGPSGVGKTETALALADLLYGGDKFLTSINMSEFQEKHTVSRLIGSPPGYVGYGEGGVLTEAVRQRPYSVVLLDECEKADLEVMNLFYQVFDKGVLNDGEGRTINFRNTMIILTSNLATEEIMEIYGRDEVPSMEEVVHEIRPILSAHFKPALLARTSVVPYGPITPDTMRLITRMKLRSLGKRIEESHKFTPNFDEELIEEIARRCTESETGARNVDNILRGTLMPMVASELLAIMSDGDAPTGLEAGLAPDGRFRVDVDVAED